MSRRDSVKSAWQNNTSLNNSTGDECEIENQIPLGRNSLRLLSAKQAEKLRSDREQCQRHRYTVGTRQHQRPSHLEMSRSRGGSLVSVGTEPNSVAMSYTTEIENALVVVKKEMNNAETVKKMELEVLKTHRKTDEEIHKMKKGLREYYQNQAEFIDFVLEHEQSKKDEELQEELNKNIEQLLDSEGEKGIQNGVVVIDMDESCTVPTNVVQEPKGKTVQSEEKKEQNPSPETPILTEKELQQKIINRQIKISINASFIANIFLLLIKIYAAIASGSLAVIASSIDSVMDLFSGSVVWLANYLANRRNYYAFPVGKSRYEPIAIIVFAALMAVAAIQLIAEGAQSLARGSAESSADVVTFIILGVIILTKATLLWYCSKVKQHSSSVSALALDHFSDILTNSATLIAVALAAEYPSVWFLDPAAAVALAIWIIVLWSGEALEQIQLIASQAATPAQISQLTYVALTHDDENVQHVDTVLAYTVGNRLQAEVDIVLPKEMPLSVAHDIGETLQRSLENLEFVERAFVHLDSDFDHSRSIEHISPYDRR